MRNLYFFQQSGKKFSKLENSIITTSDIEYNKAMNQDYQYSIKVTGKSSNMKGKRYYIVLTNDKNVTFEEVDSYFWSSTLDVDNKFYIIESGLCDK